jgi:hypothetical protein
VKRSSKSKKTISKSEFVKRFTELTIRNFSDLSVTERETRLQAAESRLGINVRGVHPKPSCTEETRATRLVAQSPRE